MKKLIVSALAFGPLFVFAQTPAVQPNTSLAPVRGYLNTIQDLVRIAIPLLVAVALLVFFWGLVQFIANAGDDDKRKEGKQHMIWGIVGLFVMVSVWGLVGFLGSVIGIQNSPNSVSVPTVSGY
jgi:hypothetical protein